MMLHAAANRPRRNPRPVAGSTRWSRLAHALAAGTLIAGTLTAVTAGAHHPGSHAVRQGDGRIAVDIAALGSDSCVTIGSIAPGRPSGASGGGEALPVTVRLTKAGSGQACAQAIRPITGKTMLDPARDRRHVFIYVVAPDGQIQSTERVPITR
jgi:hypothetical protein